MWHLFWTSRPQNTTLKFNPHAIIIKLLELPQLSCSQPAQLPTCSTCLSAHSSTGCEGIKANPGWGAWQTTHAAFDIPCPPNNLARQLLILINLNGRGIRMEGMGSHERKLPRLFSAFSSHPTRVSLPLAALRFSANDIIFLS